MTADHTHGPCPICGHPLRCPACDGRRGGGANTTAQARVRALPKAGAGRPKGKHDSKPRRPGRWPNGAPSKARPSEPAAAAPDRLNAEVPTV